MRTRMETYSIELTRITRQKTEERAKAAADWVEQEIEKLIKVILEMGEYDPEEGGIKTVKFGPLFYKYADISDTLGELTGNFINHLRTNTRNSGNLDASQEAKAPLLSGRYALPNDARPCQNHCPQVICVVSPPSLQLLDILLLAPLFYFLFA